MNSPDRKAILQPFENIKSLKVILSMEYGDCGSVVDILIRETQKYDIDIKFLLLNYTKVQIPKWIVKDNITILNQDVDFKGSKMLTEEHYEFCERSCDMCMVFTRKPSGLIDSLVEMINANLKIGPDFGHEPKMFDLMLKVRRNSSNEASQILFGYFDQLKRITQNRVNSNQ